MEYILKIFNDYSFLLFIIALNTLSSSIGTLKSILVVKYNGFITALMVLLDALIYAMVLKSFSSNGVQAIVAYVAGHTFGYWIGSWICNKMELGFLDLQIYVKDYFKMMELQEEFLKRGYSSTCEVGIITQDTSRYSLNLQIQKKELSTIKAIIKEHGIKNPTMLARELSSVYGKINERMK